MMINVVAIGIVCALWLAGVPEVWGLEFSADQITRTDGHTRKANIYYRDQMWRLEHQDLGPVNISIVRKDKAVAWLLLSRIRYFKTIPYDPDQAPKVTEHLDGEVAREEIGTQTLDGHPTTLYLVTVGRGGTDGTVPYTEDYYQWLATDIRFPLKLEKKDGSWTVEYQHVRLRPIADIFFELPLSFRPLEEVEQSKKKRERM